MYSNAAVMFLVTRNSCANLSNRALVSVALGAGLIGWQGFGLTGALFSISASWWIGAGAAIMVKGAINAARSSETCMLPLFSMWMLKDEC